MIMERKNKFLSLAKTEGAKFVLYLPRLALRKLSDSSYVYVTRNHAKQALKRILRIIFIVNITYSRINSTPAFVGTDYRETGRRKFTMLFVQLNRN